MHLCFLVLGDNTLMTIAHICLMIIIDDQCTELSLAHPLIWKVNGVFALLGESKKGDQQGDVALTDNNITGQNHTQVYDRLHANSIKFDTILMAMVVACQVNTPNGQGKK